MAGIGDCHELWRSHPEAFKKVLAYCMERRFLTDGEKAMFTEMGPFTWLPDGRLKCRDLTFKCSSGKDGGVITAGNFCGKGAAWIGEQEYSRD